MAENDLAHWAAVLQCTAIRELFEEQLGATRDVLPSLLATRRTAGLYCERAETVEKSEEWQLDFRDRATSEAESVESVNDDWSWS